jgi:hypothetical protein
LSIGEAQSLAAQLLTERSVLFLEIFNHVLLVSIDPAGEDQHQKKLQWQTIHQPDLRSAMPGEMGEKRRSGTRLSNWNRACS